MATKNFLIIGLLVTSIIYLTMNGLSTFDVENQINYQKTTTSGHTRKLLQAPSDSFYLAECDGYLDLDKDAMLYARRSSNFVGVNSYCQDISTTRRMFCICLELIGEIMRTQGFFDPTDPHINQTVYNILDSRINSISTTRQLLRQRNDSNEAIRGSCQSVSNMNGNQNSVLSCVSRYASSLAPLVHPQEGEVNGSSRNGAYGGLSYDTNVPQLLPPVNLYPRRFWSSFDIASNSYDQRVSEWQNLNMHEYPERSASSYLGRPNMNQYLASLMTPSERSSTLSIPFDPTREIPEVSDAGSYLDMGGCCPASDQYQCMAPIQDNQTNHTYQNIPPNKSDDSEVSSLSSYKESDHSDSSSIQDQQDGRSVNTYESIQDQQDGHSVNTYESIQDQQDSRSVNTYESIYNPQDNSTTSQNEPIYSEDESTTSRDVPHSIHYRWANPPQSDFGITSNQTRRDSNIQPITGGIGSYWSSIPINARNCIICLCRRRSLEYDS